MTSTALMACAGHRRGDERTTVAALKDLSATFAVHGLARERCRATELCLAGRPRLSDPSSDDNGATRHTLDTNHSPILSLPDNVADLRAAEAAAAD